MIINKKKSILFLSLMFLLFLSAILFFLFNFWIVGIMLFFGFIVVGIYFVINMDNKNKLKSETSTETKIISPKSTLYFKVFFYIYLSLLILLILNPLTLIFGLFTGTNIADILYKIIIYSSAVPILLLPIVFIIYLYNYRKKNKLTKELELIKGCLWAQLILLFLAVIFHSEWPVFICIIISIFILCVLVKVINSNYPKTKWIKTKEGKLVLFLIIVYILVNILITLLTAFISENIIL